jgi:hypothetical protein
MHVLHSNSFLQKQRGPRKNEFHLRKIHKMPSTANWKLSFHLEESESAPIADNICRETKKIRFFCVFRTFRLKTVIYECPTKEISSQLREMDPLLPTADFYKFINSRKTLRLIGIHAFYLPITRIE